MNSAHSTLAALPLLLFSMLMASVIAWFIMATHLFRLLRTRHPDVYDSLGRPTLILNNNVQNGWLFMRFLLGGRFEKIDDAETLRLCQFMRVFAYCYFGLFIATVACFLFSTAHPAR